MTKTTDPLQDDIEILDTEYFPEQKHKNLSVSPPIQFNNTSAFMQWFESKVETHNIQPSPLKACKLTREEVLSLTKDMRPIPEDQISDGMLPFKSLSNIISKSHCIKREEREGIIYYSFSDIKKLLNSLTI